MPTVVSSLSWADQFGASISTDSEVEGLGVRSLLTPVLAEVWRTGPGTIRNLAVDLGAVRGITVLALYAPRDGLLPYPGATISVALSAVSAGGTDAGFSSDALDMTRGYWALVFPQPVSARHIQISISSAQPYLQFGRLWIGPSLYLPNYLGQDAFAPEVFDAAAEATRRRVQVTLPQMPQSQADLLEDVGLFAGTQRQVLVIPRVERANRTAIIGKFTQIPAPKPRAAWNQNGLLHTATLSIQEDR